MKQQLADYLNAETAELKARQRKNITLADIDAQIARTADPIATDLLYKERDRMVSEALRAPKAVLDSIRRNKTLASTARKWEELANEAIADAGYWKNEARKAQGQARISLSTLRVMVRAFNVEKIDPLVAFAAIEKAQAVIAKCEASHLSNSESNTAQQ